MSREALGGVQSQLMLMIDAARADGSAKVAVSCGTSVIELRFDDDGIVAEADRDASRAGVTALSAEDEIVLEILGWRRGERDSFVREWHPHTSSESVADDVMRAAVNAYRCDFVELKVMLREAIHAISAR